MKIKLFFYALTGAMFLYACNESASNKAGEINDSIEVQLPASENFTDSIDNKLVSLFVLKNSNGVTAAITNYGGRLVSLLVPGNDGKFRDVVVGFKSVNEYVNSTEPYFGATIGRYGNRIANGKIHFGW
jgi:aldose 1-epimerase